MIEEKEYVDRIKRELEEEKLRSRFKRLKDSNERYLEYQNFLEKKKVGLKKF
jgi:hypothetical protein